ncbi:site-specific tyrosine recombinase [Tenacibaculum finnmarkense]|uniref:Tyrosine recombinase XerC n=1 Tax=Tenacibaculum finnmarkense genomovar finnmarkense TaxID=1458503 RepID=A0AAP1RFL7_9FLAO|nr:site-specific tyrosine recombinase [Tenacibaculum finnmarkense]MBE7652792.1 tyrosine recombinase [Tenacibaculum finnmarkense genomovar finnmarkense]MBE7695162.1 tyrosine recombinase [Tenacibaculum finnmarkense genomovar finnmarkense]MCD8427186.1 tyrosine recombinase XerD [Tenacibaculum finnmarkense genomovar finnmarkense]MCG8769892.1 tyrosine recombinase XerD [Tenacibaculum finnmarkense]MCG8774921.1 tyrosine recombinase XerD [Tenacibaculum finnmarkense]
MNWKQAISDYTNFLKIEKGLAKNSIESYSRDIKKLILFIDTLNTPISPINITSEIIEQFMYDISQKLNPRSKARLISGLRSFFDYLVFEDYRKDNPTDLIESPNTIRKLPDTLEKEEIDNLINAIDLSHPQGERNKTIIETIFSCGLRVSELINLQLSDLFFNEGYIRVLGKGNKYRFVPIHSTTIDRLNFYINDIRPAITPKEKEEDIIFLNRRGSRLSRQMIFIILKELAIKTNLKKSIGPHTLRHSFATYLLKNGADLRVIQQLLGHESITTTEIYVHLDTSYLKEVVNLHHPRSAININDQ